MPPVPATSPSPLLVLLGSTASGKEAAAVVAAERLGAEIVCADSVKPYRGLALAAAAPPPEALARVRHHLAGTLEPTESLNVRRWCALVDEAVRDIRSRGVRPLLVGGTALYLRGFLWGVFEGPEAHAELRAELRAEEAARPGALHEWLAERDPAGAALLHPRDVRRLVRAIEVLRTTGRPIREHQTQWQGAPREPFLAAGLRRTREDLYRRIDARIDRMLAQGLVDEVRALDSAGRIGPTAGEAIGVKELVPMLRRERETGARDPAALAQAVAALRRNTRTFARRQDTWWRSFPGVTWLEVSSDEPAAETGERIAEHFGSALASKSVESPVPPSPEARSR